MGRVDDSHRHRVFCETEQRRKAIAFAAYYPSPAGPVESLLSLEMWHPAFDRLEADTQALLVNRAAREYFVLPIDECLPLGWIDAHTLERFVGRLRGVARNPIVFPGNEESSRGLVRACLICSSRSNPPKASRLRRCPCSRFACAWKTARRGRPFIPSLYTRKSRSKRRSAAIPIAEQDRLLDLFGESQRWGQTLRPMLWTHADATVPAFSDSIAVDLRVPCSFDFNLAATKYFYGLSDGDIPLIFLFSGSCFYAGASGRSGSCAHPVEQRIALSPSGERVARNDGALLPELGLAADSPGCF